MPLVCSENFSTHESIEITLIYSIDKRSDESKEIKKKNKMNIKRKHEAKTEKIHKCMLLRINDTNIRHVEPVNISEL